ncbi:MAG: restriction endonuclease [Alysiella sp.]|uniref:restriction endonuclease n=1 Tax=Alysiella sp. TaxID=1872483 RepID=UPI0026DBA421|nr:restriction endonuclease [Alysiella sp.]MDO4434077.1 restriction endonuclease [Alysiella sp.]
MRPETQQAIKQIITHYNIVMEVMEDNAIEQDEDKSRAYGGVIRATKGKLQEFITQKLIETAWIHELKQDSSRLEINSKKIPIPIQPEYLKHLPDVVKNHIQNNIKDYVYKLSVDKHIFIDKQFVAGVECKAYTENAMIKRIMVDFMFLKTLYPDLDCYLFQLESQLGGDYAELKSISLGSKSTHSIMSYFDNVDLNILTFIKGERDVNKPINKVEFFKPLETAALQNAVVHLCGTLKKFKK